MKYLKLIRAADDEEYLSDLVDVNRGLKIEEEMMEEIRQGYILAGDEFGDSIVREDVVGALHEQVNILAVIGSQLGDRIYLEEATVIVDANGDKWIEENLFWDLTT